MSETLTLELPDDLAQRARALAAASSVPLEDAVIEWLRRALEAAVETLSDESLLALCDASMTPGDQEALSDLLARHREGALPDADRERLDALMEEYRRGLVLKAGAWREAVARGLRPPLDDGA